MSSARSPRSRACCCSGGCSTPVTSAVSKRRSGSATTEGAGLLLLPRENLPAEAVVPLERLAVALRLGPDVEQLEVQAGPLPLRNRTAIAGVAPRLERTERPRLGVEGR